MRIVAALGVVWAAVGCAASYPRPMLASDVAGADSPEALIAYLQQPDASPSVCDPRARGPHLSHLDGETWAALVDAMTTGRIGVGAWRRCVDQASDAASPERLAPLLDAVARAYRSLIHDRALETSPELPARLAALQSLYIERPSGLHGHPATVAAALEDVRKAYVRHQLGPVATRFAGEMAAINELEAGRYGGRAVDDAVLDGWQRDGEEVLLRRAVVRLPAARLRSEAARRLVALRIASSPYREVRESAAQLTPRIVQQGNNRLSLAEHPPLGASLNRANLPVDTIMVRQDVVNQRAIFIDRNGISVPTPLALAGALWVVVAGVSRPITLCQPPRMLDPSPCLGAEDVTIDNDLFYLDRDGAFHLVEQISARDVAALARAQHQLTLPISVGRRRMTTVSWRFRFERPGPLERVATGETRALKVAVSNSDPSLFEFTVDDDSAIFRAVVEQEDLSSFRVVSRGSPGGGGSDGASGTDGSPGWDGVMGSCPSSSGGDGSRGGDGGSGQPGGDGGPGGAGPDIAVLVDCGPVVCSPAVLASLRAIIHSEGGPGGPGGRGGRGGRGGAGGAGGSGAFCIDGDGTSQWVSAGAAGLAGSDGVSGSDGLDGPVGRPGRVTFTLTPAGASAF